MFLLIPEFNNGDSLVSIQIEKKRPRDDAWWAIYNHEKDEVFAKGTNYLDGSTYQYNYCIEENVCIVMYLESIEKVENSHLLMCIKIFFPNNFTCGPDIPNPFAASSAWIFRIDFSLVLMLASLIGLMWIQ